MCLLIVFALTDALVSKYCDMRLNRPLVEEFTTTDSVLSGNLLPLNLLGASRYFCEKFELVFLKIVNCDFD